jgi:hypothetical protein
VATVLLVSGCSGGDGPAVVLDGRPRHPDAEGVVTAVTRERLTLDGDRTYGVSPSLRAFSTSSLKAVPLLGRSGQYVVVGLDGDTVVWLGAVGAVLRVPGERPVTYYTGELVRVEDGRAVFRDGTVLRLASGVRAVAPGRARAEIDVERHTVRVLVRL